MFRYFSLIFHSSPIFIYTYFYVVDAFIKSNIQVRQIALRAYGGQRICWAQVQLGRAFSECPVSSTGAGAAPCLPIKKKKDKNLVREHYMSTDKVQH